MFAWWVGIRNPPDLRIIRATFFTQNYTQKKLDVWLQPDKRQPAARHRGGTGETSQS